MDTYSAAFMFIVFAIGIYLMYTTIQIDRTLGNCINKKLSTYNKVLFGLSMACIIIPVSYIACHSMCDCGDAEAASSYVYAGLISTLGIAMIVLGAMINGISASDCKEAVWYGKPVWIVGIILTLTSAVYIYHTAMEQKYLNMSPQEKAQERMQRDQEKAQKVAKDRERDFLAEKQKRIETDKLYKTRDQVMKDAVIASRIRSAKYDQPKPMIR